MSDQPMFVAGKDVFDVLRSAQEKAAAAAAGQDDPRAEPMACLTLLATALNIALLCSGQHLSDEEHDTIRQASRMGAKVGFAELQRLEDARRARH